MVAPFLKRRFDRQLTHWLWLLCFLALMLLASAAHAARTVASVTLDAGTTVTVAPGASITAVINVTTSGGGPNANWYSSGWLISNTAPGSVTCVNHANHGSSSSETFSLTAPTTPGTYNAYFIAYSDDGCTSGASTTYVMAGAVTVSASLSSSLIAEYRFDQCDQYTGAIGEVVDTAGGYPGTPMLGLQNAVGGQLYKSADFSSANRYVNVPSGPTLGDWSISVWFQTPFAGSASHSSPYYIIGSVSGGGDFAFLDRGSGYRW